MASLRDAYESVKQTTEQIKREGREESPLQNIFTEATDDLTEDLKLKNLVDPDYEPSNTGSIISMFAPKFRENALARGLEKQAKIDEDIWVSQVGLRELQEKERVSNNLNLDAVKTKAKLNNKINTKGMSLIESTVGDSTMHKSIFAALKETGDERALNALTNIENSNRKARIEQGDTYPGTDKPVFSFTHNGNRFHIFDRNTLDYNKYDKSIKNIKKYIFDNLTEGSGIKKETLEKFKAGSKLSPEEQKEIQTNETYLKMYRAAAVNNEAAFQNYPPVSDQLNTWQKEYIALHRKQHDANLRLLQKAEKEHGAITTRLIAREVWDEKGKFTGTKDEKAALVNAEKNVRTLQNAVILSKAALSRNILGLKQRIMGTMVRLAQQRGTTIHQNNAESLRLEADVIVQQEMLEESAIKSQNKIKNIKDDTQKTSLVPNKTSTGKKEEEAKTVNGITWNKAKAKGKGS